MFFGFRHSAFGFVQHVTAITHRKDAVYPATIVGIPPMEDFYIGGAALALLGAHAPSRVGFDALVETIFARRRIRSARALTDAREARALPSVRTPTRNAIQFSPKGQPMFWIMPPLKLRWEQSWELTPRAISPVKASKDRGRP